MNAVILSLAHVLGALFALGGTLLFIAATKARHPDDDKVAVFGSFIVLFGIVLLFV